MKILGVYIGKLNPDELGGIVDSKTFDEVAKELGYTKGGSSPGIRCTLKQGDANLDVGLLQEALRWTGAKISLTSYYGRQTRDRVLTAQRAAGLPETGECTPEFFEFLKEAAYNERTFF